MSRRLLRMMSRQLPGEGLRPAASANLRRSIGRAVLMGAAAVVAHFYADPASLWSAGFAIHLASGKIREGRANYLTCPSDIPLKVTEKSNCTRGSAYCKSLFFFTEIVRKPEAMRMQKGRISGCERSNVQCYEPDLNTPWNDRAAN